MTKLLEKIRSFNEPASEFKVEELTSYLGDNPSIPVLEAALKYYKSEERRLRTEDLLEWMQENDQVTFETDGCKVSIRTSVSAKVIDAELGFNWLTEHQYGDMIKDSLEFPKGELTQEAEGALEELGLSFTKKSGIHPQTLKKIISDRLKDGEDLPDDDQGIKVGYFDECIVKEK